MHHDVIMKISFLSSLCIYACDKDIYKSIKWKRVTLIRYESTTYSLKQYFMNRLNAWHFLLSYNLSNSWIQYVFQIPLIFGFKFMIWLFCRSIFWILSYVRACSRFCYCKQTQNLGMEWTVIIRLGAFVRKYYTQ